MPWNLIPQIFYDFLARVIPGTITLIVGLLVSWGYIKTNNPSLTASSIQGILSFSISIIGIFIAYILGFIFQELWEVLFKPLHKKWTSRTEAKFKITKNALEKLKEEKKHKAIEVSGEVIEKLKSLKEKVTKEECFIEYLKTNLKETWLALDDESRKSIVMSARIQNNPICSAIRYHNRIRDVVKMEHLPFTKENDVPPVHTMHDHLRLLSEPEGYRLLKLRAEYNMCRALSIGFSLLVVLNTGFLISDANIERFLLEVLLLSAVWAFWRQSAKLENYYRHGTCTQWLLKSCPVKLRESGS